MKKNLLDPEAAWEMAKRIERLRPDTSPRWGKMNATEMLLHMNKVHQQLLSPAAATTKKTSLKQLLIRWLVLYVMPRYPKGAKTPSVFDTKGAAKQDVFDEQKRLFTELLQRFAAMEEPIRHYHPYFGALSTSQWGVASWKHADHHLRQFGL
jgi:hypothetical protein